MNEPDYKKILEYVKIMDDMVKRARAAKTVTEKIENLGLVSEACKQLSSDFETWIAENDQAIDEAMDEESESPRKQQKNRSSSRNSSRMTRIVSMTTTTSKWDAQMGAR